MEQARAVQQSSTEPSSESAEAAKPKSKPFFGHGVIFGTLFITILVAISLGLAIFAGPSLSIFLSAFVFAGGVIAGFSYIFRCGDDIRKHGMKHGWKNVPVRATLTGSLVGLTLSIVGHTLGVSTTGLDNLGPTGAGTVTYLVNVGAWSSIFNRYWDDRRPPWERRVHRITAWLGILAGGSIIFCHYRFGYTFDNFVGVPGLDITTGPLGDLPVASDILFVAGLTIVSTSFVSYSYRGLVYFLNSPTLMPTHPEMIKEYRDAAYGVALGTGLTIAVIALALTTPLLPTLPIPALIFLGITLISSAGGVFSRVRKAWRCFSADPQVDDSETLPPPAPPQAASTFQNSKDSHHNPYTYQQLNEQLNESSHSSTPIPPASETDRPNKEPHKITASETDPPNKEPHILESDLDPTNKEPNQITASETFIVFNSTSQMQEIPPTPTSPPPPSPSVMVTPRVTPQGTPLPSPSSSHESFLPAPPSTQLTTKLPSAQPTKRITSSVKRITSSVSAPDLHSIRAPGAPGS